MFFFKLQQLQLREYKYIFFYEICKELITEQDERSMDVQLFDHLYYLKKIYNEVIMHRYQGIKNSK